jgi:hypothetical protein
MSYSSTIKCCICNRECEWIEGEEICTKCITGLFLENFYIPRRKTTIIGDNVIQLEKKIKHLLKEPLNFESNNSPM